MRALACRPASPPSDNRRVASRPALGPAPQRAVTLVQPRAVTARCAAGSSLAPAAADRRARVRRRYVECAFPEIDKAKVVEAAFGGEINCMVFRWGVADLAALMMKLGYFAGPS